MPFFDIELPDKAEFAMSLCDRVCQPIQGLKVIRARIPLAEHGLQ